MTQMTIKRYWKQLLVTSENNCLTQLFFILLFLWNKMAHICWVQKTAQSWPLRAARISSCKCNTHNPGLAEVIGRFSPSYLDAQLCCYSVVITSFWWLIYHHHSDQSGCRMNLLLMFCDFFYHSGNSFHTTKLNTETRLFTLLLQMGQSFVSGLSVIFSCFFVMLT